MHTREKPRQSLKDNRPVAPSFYHHPPLDLDVSLGDFRGFPLNRRKSSSSNYSLLTLLVLQELDNLEARNLPSVKGKENPFVTRIAHLLQEKYLLTQLEGNSTAALY